VKIHCDIHGWQYTVGMQCMECVRMTKNRSELDDALALAKCLLNEPNADPDDDLRMLARQLMRAREEIARLTATPVIFQPAGEFTYPGPACIEDNDELTYPSAHPGIP
jgi:hypothetical protein